MNKERMAVLQNRAAQIVASLRDAGLRLATAESCTGGLLSQCVTSVSGASAVFDFGAVTYANAMKRKLLGVTEDTLAVYGAVSAQTAEQMAKGIVDFSGAQIGIGITGIAGPGSDGTDKPVGLIYVALADCGGYLKTSRLNNRFDADVRENNRIAAVEAAFDLLDEYVTTGGK